MDERLLDYIPAIEALRQKYATGAPVRVLFVCLGNICRSPAAQGIMQKLVDDHGDSAAWSIDSAGTGGWHVGDMPDKRMRVHAIRRGYTLDHVCRQVREADFDNFDIILGMDHSNVANLRHMAPTLEAGAKVVPMAVFLRTFFPQDCIPDPYYDGDDGFENVITLLEDGCTHLAQIVRGDTL